MIQTAVNIAKYKNKMQPKEKMCRKGLFSLAILFSLFSSFSVAQTFTLNGMIQNIDQVVVPFASVALSNKADTSTLQFCISQENGSFRLKNVSTGTYLIVVACIGYDIIYESVLVDSSDVSLTLTLNPSTISMKEVMIRARAIPVIMNGDTVVYNSSSFKTQSNANVEDLIKKMPGIQVDKDGKVSSEGQQITRVLINGKEFFGGNVEAATKNLDASLVDKVEVIDKKTDEDEFTGEEGNQREKVINIVLKEDKAQGYFGTVRAGYGNKDYYDLKGNINFFKDATQLSLIGGFNNINKKIYGWEEMGALNTFEIQPFNNNSNNWNWNGGVSSHKGVGANVHIEPRKGMTADISYVVTSENNVRNNDRNKEIYLTNNTVFSDEQSESGGDKNNHQINSKIVFEPDTLNRLVLRTQFDKELGVNISKSLTTNFINPDTIINSGALLNERKDGNQKFIAKLHWTRKSKIKNDNRFMGSVYLGTSEVANKRQNYFDRANTLLPFPSNETANLVQNLTTKKNTIALTAAYQIQLSKKWMIRPGINWMLGDYKHDFEWLPAGKQKLLSNSPKGGVVAQNLEYYIHISYKLDSFTTLYFVPEINQSIERRNFTTNVDSGFGFNQHFFIPYMFLRSNKAHKYDFFFNLRANVNRPDINQMLPVTDSTNPFNTNKGNIAIQNFINYTNNWRYQRIFGLGKTLFFNGYNSFSYRPVINKNTVTAENIATSTVINFKNRVYSSSTIGFTWPIKAIKATVGADLNYNFGQSYLLQNEQELVSQNHTIGFGPTLQFNEFDMWSFDAEYSLQYQNGRIGTTTNNAFFSHEVDAELVFTPVDRIEWSTTLYLEIFGANNAVGAQTIPIFSSELSYFIDKNQQWSLGARAYDIFDKNQNLWRWWSNNSFTQSQSNAVQRYVMATLTYKIKKPMKKAKEIIQN